MSEPTTDREIIERIMVPCKYDTHRIVRDLVAALATAREEAFEEGVKQVNHAIRLIERAEQRERCASIAWEYGREETDPLYKDFACEIADEIADRIRNASLAPGEQPEEARRRK